VLATMASLDADREAHLDEALDRQAARPWRRWAATTTRVPRNARWPRRPLDRVKRGLRRAP